MDNANEESTLRDANAYVAPYPDQDSEDFNFDVLLTREFYDPEKDGKPLVQGEKDPPLKKHQKLLQRYINPRTQYNDVLVFHDMGTGKTRSAMAIALAIKNQTTNFSVPSIFVGRKFVFPSGKEATITSLSPLKARLQSTRQEIGVDPSEIPYPGRIQKVFVLSSSKKAGKVFRKELKKMYPEIFNDPFNPGSASKYNKTAMKNYITHLWTYQFFNQQIRKKNKAYFNNSLFIVDEAHNLIPQSEAGQKYAQYNRIKNLFNTLPNRKVVLLTGTPLVNDPSDIVPLMQLILPPDALVWDTVLDASGSLDPEFVKEFVEETRGKISYLKQSPNVVRSEEMGTLEEPFSHFKLTRLTMSSFQTRALKNAATHDDDDPDATESEADDDPDPGGIRDVAGNKKSQASLMAWPGPDDEPLVGTSGYQYCTQKNKNDEVQFTSRFISQITTEGSMDLSKLKKYSCKYAYLLKSLKKAKGPIFAYCRLIINGGVKTLELLLKQMGYSKFDGQKTPGKRFLSFTGTNPPSESTLQTFNSKENKEGKLCKLIIGSRAASEVYTFKSLVEEIVITPFWNNLEIQQALARGIRLDSHPYTPDAVVKIVKLAAVPNDATPSHDLRIYKIAEDRDISNKKLEDLIKRTAFDCELNKDWNMRDADKDMSRSCDYLPCDYDCEVQDKIDEENFDLANPPYADSDGTPRCSSDEACIQSASWNLYYSPDLAKPIVRYIAQNPDSVEFTLKEIYLYALAKNPHLTVTAMVSAIAKIEKDRQIVGCRWGKDCYIVTFEDKIYLTFDVVPATHPMDILGNTFYVSNPAFRPSEQYRIKDQVGQFTRGTSELETALETNSLLKPKVGTRREFKGCKVISFFSMKIQESLLENAATYRMHGNRGNQTKMQLAESVETYYSTVMIKTDEGVEISVLDYFFGGKQVGEIGVIPPEGWGTMRATQDRKVWRDATPDEKEEATEHFRNLLDNLKNDGRTWMKKSYLPPCQVCIVPPQKYATLFKKMRSKKNKLGAKAGDARFDLVGKLCSSFTKNEIIVMIVDEFVALRQTNSPFYREAAGMLPVSTKTDALAARDQKTRATLLAETDLGSSSTWGDLENGESRLINLIRMNKTQLCNILTRFLAASNRVVPDKYCGMAPKKRKDSKK